MKKNSVKIAAAIGVMIAMAWGQYRTSKLLLRDAYGVVAVNLADVAITTSQGFPLDSSGRLAIDCANCGTPEYIIGTGRALAAGIAPVQNK
jgi:hypothetical protein